MAARSSARVPVPARQHLDQQHNLVGKAINPVTYKGIRASALFQANDDWSALLTQSYQDMRAEGVFSETQYTSQGLPCLTCQCKLYNPSFDHDRFETPPSRFNGVSTS